MRKSVSPSFGKTATRLFVAALLASVATGCSSDVSRFGGVFSTSDNITTNSVPRRTLFGSNPVPRGEVAGAGQVVPVTADESRDTALNQPFPGQDDISRDPINTSTNTGSGTRLASTPVIVEREALVDPNRAREREEALSQPLPGARQTTTEQARKTRILPARPIPARLKSSIEAAGSSSQFDIARTPPPRTR